MTSTSASPAALASLSASLAAVAALACGSPAVAPAPHAPDRRPDPGPADLVLRGGDILTMDDARPRATALAARGDRIVAVGDDADVAPLVGPDTRVIELAGRTVTPGLVDAHCHLLGLGVALETVSVRGAASADAAAVEAARAAAGRPPGEWITGRGWDQNLWTPVEFPHRRALDAHVPDRPVALRRVDGHALWVNTAALTLAKITRDTPDPAGGRIVRGPDGEPTGVLVDEAMWLVERHIPAASAAVRERRILRAAAAALAVGLTGVHEMGIDDVTAGVYRDLARRGELPIRVNAYLSGEALETLAAITARAPEPDDGASMFAARGIKLYADGALGSRGAWLLSPYADDPGNRGLAITPPDQLAAAAATAASAGWQLATHAIGDAANRAVLDAYEAAIRAHPGADLRLRVEHAQVLAPADIPRFGALGVLASMQPTHATSDMPWAGARLGPERVRGAYAWRDVIAAGGTLVAGSDFPVEDVSPLLGLYAAVTRADARGEPPGGWHPAQRLTLDEAVRAFTVAPAYAGFVDGHRGRLAPGMVADIAVFDRPLRPDAGLLDTRVDVTVVGGRIAHERK